MQLDEEVVGALGDVHTSLTEHAGKGAPGASKAFFPATGSTIPSHSRFSEDARETAKQRLQALIRDFAHAVVGTGIFVLAVSEDLVAAGIAHDGGGAKLKLRMDRRLSRIELWPPVEPHEELQHVNPNLVISLKEISALLKSSEDAEPGGTNAVASRRPVGDAEDPNSLTIIHKLGPPLQLTFDGQVARDKAYTCLWIFQMSVDSVVGPAEHGPAGSASA